MAPAPAELMVGRMRKRGLGFVAVASVVLASLLVTAAVVGVWGRRNFLDTDRFTSRAAPLASDPAVQEVVATRLTDEVMGFVDPEELFREALPERGQILAGPLANALTGFVRDRVQEFTASDTFAELWERAIRRAHSTAVDVLRDEGSDVVRTANGTVKIDLSVAIEEVLAQISSASPELFGREINIPDVSLDDVPAAAKTRLEQSFGIDLDDEEFGQITVYRSDQLAAAQDALKLFDQTVIALVLGSVLAIGLALLASRRRRVTILQLCAGILIGMVVLRRVGLRIDGEIAGLAKTPAGATAVDHVIDAFLNPLLDFAFYLAVAMVLVAVVALATSDYPRMVTARGWTTEHAGALLQSVRGKAADDSVVAWVQQNRTAILAGAIGLGVVILWTVSLSWFGLLLVIAAVVGVVVFVQRAGTPPSPPSGSAPAVAGGGPTP
jgi:hypothetical protein